ncbi:MAG: PAS domain S-box protein, partial [Candidatus Dadabacteria bacterium]
MAGTVFIVTGQIAGVPALAWGAPVCFAIGLVASALRYQRTIRAVSTALEAPGRTTTLRSLGLDSLAEQIERLTLTVSQQARDVRDQNRTLTLLLDNLADGVIATDRSGAILTLNRSACRLLGAEPARLLGARVQSVLRHAALHEALDQALSGDPGPAQTLELGQHVPGSGRRELLIRVAGVRGPDDVLMAGLLVLRDVTDMRRLEQLRRDFVANVSHELKTPVTSIRGAAETLASGALSDQEAAPRFVAMIERQAAR